MMPSINGVPYPAPPAKTLEDTNSEEYWRARADASSLKEAEAIKADKKRLDGARYVLEKEEAQRVAALKTARAAAKKNDK